MLSFLQTLTDDQTAICGCVGALVAATILLKISFHANPQNRQDRLDQVTVDQQLKTEPEAGSQRRAA